MPDETRQILDVLRLAERLKFELRHSWLSDGRRESVAEHTYQMALMALLLHRRLEHDVDLEKSLKMVLVHDLVEAEAGDVPYFETGRRRENKSAAERAAIDRIRDMLPSDVGAELHALWHEFEAADSMEAKFAQALDHLEVQLQHNLADISTWEEIEYDLVYTKMDDRCAHDSTLRELCAAIRSDAEEKIKAAGIDVAAVRARHGG